MMKKIVKWILGTVLTLVILVAVAVAALVLLVDPNSFKPQLEALAKDQKLHLSIGGDIHWQFYPSLGFSIAQVSLAPEATPKDILLSMESLSLAVDVMALLNKDLKVQGIEITGLTANLQVDKSGVGNWSTLMSADQSTPDTDSADTSATPFSIKHFALTNSHIIYNDLQAESRYELQDLAVRGENIALNSSLFPFVITANFNMTNADKSVQKGNVDFEAMLAIDKDISTVDISSSTLLAVLESQTDTKKIKTNASIKVVLPTKDQAWKINDLQLNQLEASMVDASGAQDISVKSATLHIANMALNNQPFDFLFSGDALIKQAKQADLNANLHLEGKVAIDEAVNQVSLTAFNIVTTLPAANNLKLDINTNTVLTLEPLAYEGGFVLQSFNARDLAKMLEVELPVMANPHALEKFSVAAKMKGSANKVSLNELTLTVDDTTLSGSIDVQDIEKQQLIVRLKGDTMNVDDYLPPVPEVVAVAENTPVIDTSNDPILPLETLRSLNVDIDLQMMAMTVKKMPLKDFTLQLKGSKGIVNLSALKTNIYNGSLQLASKINAQTDQPIIDFNTKGENVPVGELMKALGIYDKFSGNADLTAKGSGVGNTQNDLMKTMNAVIDLKGKELQLLDINIEKSVCEIVSKVQNKDISNINWENLTRLQDMTTHVTITNGMVKVDAMNAGVDKIAVSSLGTMNILKGDFDFGINARLVNAVANAMQCTVTDTRLLNRDLPIRCKGNLDAIGVKTCQPDWRILESIAKDAVNQKVNEQKAQLKEKANENVDAAKAKAQNQLDSAVKKKLGDEGLKSAKDKLKGLFGK